MDRYSVFALTSVFPFDKELKMFKKILAVTLLTVLSWAGGCNQPAALPSKDRDQAAQPVNATGAAQEVKSSGGSGSK